MKKKTSNIDSENLRLPKNNYPLPNENNSVKTYNCIPPPNAGVGRLKKAVILTRRSFFIIRNFCKVSLMKKSEDSTKYAYVAIAAGITTIVVACVLLFAGTYGSQNSSPVACTLEAKICPDGSYVGRTGPNCEFEKCTVVKQTNKTEDVFCTMDAKICPDGSAVGRMPSKNCEFAPCPTTRPGASSSGATSGSAGTSSSGVAAVSVTPPLSAVMPVGVADPAICTSRSVNSCRNVTGCSVCPPCKECSSLSCHSVSYCASIGFDMDWYDSIRK